MMWTVTLKILKWLLTSVWLPLTWKGQKCKWINPQDELDAEKCCLLRYVLNSSWLPPALKKKKNQKAIWHQRKKFQELLATTGINLMNPSLAIGKVNKLTLWLPHSFALHRSGGSLASGASTRKRRLCLLAQQLSSKGKEEIKWY